MPSLFGGLEKKLLEAATETMMEMVLDPEVMKLPKEELKKEFQRRFRVRLREIIKL